MERLLSKLMVAALLTLLTGCSVKVTGLFTNMQSKHGDVSGVEVFVVRGPKSSYYAIVQCANGKPGKPVVLAATIDLHTITFDSPGPGSNCPDAPFHGEIQFSSLIGGFEGSETMELQRRDSLWQ